MQHISGCDVINIRAEQLKKLGSNCKKRYPDQFNQSGIFNRPNRNHKERAFPPPEDVEAYDKPYVPV